MFQSIGVSASPVVVIIAGPNGAGKSTAAPRLLRGALGLTEFVNADEIARGLSGFNPEGAAIAAGRIMLARLRELAGRRISFAFETTLASRSFAPWLAELKRDGYDVDIVFLWLSSADLAVQRVADRAAMGGHAVPADTIRRRYHAGIRNFIRLYCPVASSWRLFDSTGSVPRIIARGAEGKSLQVYDRNRWERIRGETTYEGCQS